MWILRPAKTSIKIARKFVLYLILSSILNLDSNKHYYKGLYH